MTAALCAGVALRHLGLRPDLPLLLPALLLLPLLPWRTPGPWCAAAGSWAAGPGSPGARWTAPRSLLLLLVLLAGWLHADGWARAEGKDCRNLLADGDPLRVEGTVVAPWRRGLVVRTRGGMPRGCTEEVRVVHAASVAGADGTVRPRVASSTPPGTEVRVSGRWSRWGLGLRADMAGALRADRVDRLADRPGVEVAAWREAARLRIERLFPDRHALVAALLLARRDGVDDATRTAFARAGVAHLLAISGFHVGVVAAVVVGLLLLTGLPRRIAFGAASVVVWGYVLLIGAPDAAVRAALLLSFVAAATLTGRALHRAGALATALLLVVLADPGSLARAGVQLSFAGAFGLAVLGPTLDRGLVRRVGWTRAVGVRRGVAVGVAATLATLPFVAWHFDRVSLVGVPVTLVGTPLVALALPGVLGALVLDVLPLVPGGAAAFLAGGADLLLGALVRTVRFAAEPSWVVAWTPRSWLLAAGCAVAVWGTLLAPARGVGRDVRAAALVLAAASGALVAPTLGALTGVGTLEVVVLDVGQGDAIALRSPAGRWVLVDAGPPAWRGDEPPRSVTALRRAGVERLDALLLTHPDLDHIGGAAAILRSMDPRAVAGPGLPRGTTEYVELLEAARRGSVSWVVLGRGDRLDLDGAVVDVLHPTGPLDTDTQPNAASLVMRVRFGAFTALLTGDAPSAVEDALAVGPVDVLKVGHHGSRTSTSAELLRSTRPTVALVSAGRNNRFGHPHGDVLERLASVAAEIHRTDRDGTVRLRAHRDGSWTVTRERPISQ